MFNNYHRVLSDNSLKIVILIIILLASHVTAQVKYPVTIGGYTGNTNLQMFAIASNGYLIISGESSDAIVSGPNKHYVMYKAQESSWLWHKELPFTSVKTLKSIVFSGDNSRVALLFSQSALVVVLNTADGSLIRIREDTSGVFTCNPGCDVLYWGSTLYTLATSANTPYKIVMFGFDPETGPTSATSVSYTSISAPSSANAQYAGAYTVGDAQIFFGLQSGTSFYYSQVMSMQQNFNQLYWTKEVQTNLIIKMMHWKQSCWTILGNTFCSSRTLGILSDNPSNTAVSLAVMDVNQTSEFDQLQHYMLTWIGATGFNYLGIEVQDQKKVSAMLQVYGLNQIVIFTTNYEGQWWGQTGCQCYKVTSSYQVSYNPGLILSNGLLRNGDSYVGGYNSWQLFSVQIGSGTSYNIPFVYSFKDSENTLASKLSWTAYTQSMTFGSTVTQTDVSMTFTANGGSITVTPTTTTLPDLINQPSPISIPKYSYEQQLPSGFNAAQLYWFIGDSTNQAVAPTIPSCGTGCVAFYQVSQAVTLPTGVNGFTIASAISPASLQIYFTLSSLVQSYSPIDLDGYGLIDPALFSNSMYVYKNMGKANLLNPLVIPDTTDIPAIVYVINDPATTPLPVPTTHFTVDVVSTYPSLSSNPLLQIQYGVRLSGSTVSWAVYDQTNKKLSISTSDNSLEGTYTLQVIAWIPFNTSAIYNGATFSVQLIHKCRSTVITPSTFTPPDILYYQIGEGTFDFSFPEWSQAFTVADCGPFTYTLQIPAPQDTAISLTTASGLKVLRFRTSSISHHMNQPSDATNYFSTLTGTLYNVNPTDSFISLTKTLSYRIISTTQTYINPPVTIPSISYITCDTAYPYQITGWSFQDTQTPSQLDLQFQILTSSMGAVDGALFSLINANPPTLVINNLDNSKIGTYQLVIKAAFNVRIPYSVTSPIFSVQILHECVRSNIVGTSMTDQSYDVGDPQININFPPWTISKKNCGPLQFKMTLVGGANLPTYIKPSASEPSLSVYSMAGGIQGLYNIQVQGFTTYMSLESDATKQFRLIINCITKKIKPVMATMYDTFLLGSPTIHTFSFDQFVAWPFCNTPDQQVEYSARLANGTMLPSQITFANNTRTFSMLDDGQMQVGTLEIYIGAKASDSVTKSFATLYLEVKQGDISSNSAFGDLNSTDGFIKLPPVFIAAAPDQQISFESTAFAKYTDQPYYLIKGDRSLVFISMQNQTLVVQPTVRDLGTAIVQLVCVLSDTQKYSQYVTIKVSFQKDSINYNRIIELKASVSKISKSGIVFIKFNQNMLIHPNATELITDRTLLIKVYNENNRQLRPQFTWQPISWEGRVITLQLNFERPFDISKSKYLQTPQDTLDITFTERELFQAETRVLIPSKYRITGKIPKQMDNSPASKYVDNMAMNIQNGLDSLSSSSVVFNIILQAFN